MCNHAFHPQKKGYLQASFKTTVTSAIVEVKVKRGESINPNDSWPVTTAYKSHHHRRPRIKFPMHIQEIGQWRVPNIEERRGGRNKRDDTLRNRTEACSKYRGEGGGRSKKDDKAFDYTP